MYDKNASLVMRPQDTEAFRRVAMVQNREVTAEALHRLVAVLG